MDLENFFAEHNKIALAFSGGADSAYLLYAAVKSGVQVKAYYVNSAFQPDFELNDAKRLAKELNADMEVIPLDVLTDHNIASNPENRCYYCKRQIFSVIMKHSLADGFTELMDGSNASDDSSDRPGMKALKELNVYSPLRECGITKSRLRELSKEAGLFTWDKPAYACLATRIPAGTFITAESLEQIEKAESYIAELGFRDFRVRLIENGAKLQLKAEQLPLLIKKRESILSSLGENFSHILLDLHTR